MSDPIKIPDGTYTINFDVDNPGNSYFNFIPADTIECEDFKDVSDVKCLANKEYTADE